MIEGEHALDAIEGATSPFMCQETHRQRGGASGDPPVLQENRSRQREILEPGGASLNPTLNQLTVSDHAAPLANEAFDNHYASTSPMPLRIPGLEMVSCRAK